ncbi:ATP-binding protein [Paraburkholderia atlantica]|uniref:ATP-binding protein n=1 Tax=Paraburkholderia atlantica TaxID=2654982 RepID=UPI00161DF5DD|nr:type IV secretion system DNA-binding domain-containing protein [Paraburkholderia atlantica]MBB5509520.1 DNA phosphorothioation-dependent restriction protein DptH [Paraburkholderia atlantica]
MNLFVEELTKYMTGECARVLAAGASGTSKITLVVQSLPLEETIAVLERLDDYFTTAFPGTERAIKISRGLWLSWNAEERAALPNATERMWVDMDDQLTTFRNKGHCIFFGFDHASDKGSLKDFHLVSEDLLWRRILGQRYRDWVHKIAGQIGDNDQRAAEALETFLSTVEKFNAGRLVRVASFFDTILARKPDSLRDLVSECYAHLPSWGALPLLDVPMGRNTTRAQRLIELGNRFTTHAMFASKSERNRVLQKIDKAQMGDDSTQPFELPTPVAEGNRAHHTPADYLDDVRLFVREHDVQALARLQQWDATPLLKIIEKREPTSTSTPKATILKGYSDVVFLQSVKLTIQRFLDENDNNASAEDLYGIKLRVTRYECSIADPIQDLHRLLNGIVGAVVPDRLSLPGIVNDIPIEFEAIDDDVPRLARATAKVMFTVSIDSGMDTVPFEQQYVWPVPTTHPERLRLVFAEQALRLLSKLSAPRLPAFHLGGFDELFSAIDEEDAHRLLMLGMSDFDVVNVFNDDAKHPLYTDLVASCTALTARYKEHLEAILTDGFYAANKSVHRVITSYSDVVKQAIGRTAGAEYVLPCLYRAFLAVRDNDNFTQPYLDAAVALPISPFVLELSSARAVFLRDGFSEIVTELFASGRAAAEQRWQRLVELAELRRPVVALVADANLALTTASQAFGLTHLIGNADRSSLPVASQSLMRQETFDEDDLGQMLQPSGRARIYEQLIRTYQELHNHSHDQLSLLFTNISEIDVVLSGVDRWLKAYLVETVEQQTPFHLTVKVITTGIATTTAVNMLVAWKDAWAESGFNNQRKCSIHIGHRHATSPRELEGMLLKERDLRYDLGVIAHFLDDQHEGDQLEPVEAFDAVSGSVLRQFPLAEYPRPIRQLAALSQRQMSISNRRVQMASKHTEIAARLKNRYTDSWREHTVVTQIDFTPWRKTIEVLHQKAVWVSCVDRQVDSNLIGAKPSESAHSDRRIVGFSCGLGNYGELNRTISTEVSDFATLTRAIAVRLRQHLPNLTKEQAELGAHNIIKSACEIPGLSLVKAIGRDEYIRDVIGYSLVSRLLGRAPSSVLQSLIPLDSFSHWFRDREDANIPDLLFLEASETDGRLHIEATIVESKFANENVGHADKAFAQASAGLRQLVKIFAPRDVPLKATVFERKYWWAQLHRALSSRAVVMLAVDKYQALCAALDRLSEGDFTIAWRAVASTFWTNKSTSQISQKFMGAVDVGLDRPLPEGFGVYQLELGIETLIQLLTQENQARFDIPGTPLVLSPTGYSNPAARVVAPQVTPIYVSEAANAGSISRDVPDANPAKATSEQSTSAAQASPFEPSAFGKSAAATANNVPLPVAQPQDDAASLCNQSALAAANPPAPSIHEPSATGSPTTSETQTGPVGRLLIGTDSRGQEVYWEYGDPELENRHLLIFGASGSGKTYAIQCLLLEMVKQRQHVAIIDYTDGFLPSKLDSLFVESAKPETHVLVQQPFPINPFQRLSREEPGIGELLEQPHNVASRVADVFCSVYTVGDVQRAALSRHIEQGLTSEGNFSLEELLHALEADPNAPQTLALKISELVKQKPFSIEQGSGWKRIFEESSLAHILQLVNISKDMQRLIAEFALWDFFAYATRNGNKDIPLPVVLDEVQNLDHRSDRAIDKLLREGRKFGVGMILATQTISNFDKEERGRLFQCAQKLFFKPAETERKEFAQILADVSPTRSRDEWVIELGKLGKGECWAVGPHRVVEGRPMRRDPIKLKVVSLEARQGA